MIIRTKKLSDDFVHSQLVPVSNHPFSEYLEPCTMHAALEWKD
jgi:hypothetical protein